ncbi:MAG: thioredoxin [Candidatus Omnitrophica bacterium]|nr:thioredoxin [Candidatus Omnitrophota bacterium]
MALLHLSDANFKTEVLESKTPVLVDFWAPWCGPCKAIAPVLEELASECGSKVKIAKVNVEESQEVATRYGIMSIPTLMFFKDGKVIEQMVGVQSKLQLKQKIEEIA